MKETDGKRSLPSAGGLTCTITVNGSLDDHWADWFGPLAMTYDAANDLTVLQGLLPDQSALHGILARLLNLNLSLVSVLCADPGRQGGKGRPPSGSNR